MKLSGWGRYPRHDARLVAPRDPDALAQLIAAGPLIARGLGRAYGDSAVNRACTVSMRHFNRFIAFDPETGQLTAEAGVTLAEIITALLPRGWFPAVTPGTRFVTLGGAIAADVHGKNHHLDGAFSSFVDWIDVIGPDGAITRASRSENPDLFWRTCGGMGLTGVILRAAIRLRAVETGWIRQRLVASRDLDETLDLFDETNGTRYSVAWIDALASGPAEGRAMLMLGEHATREDLPPERRAAPYEIPRRLRLTMPPAPPGLLNAATIRGFNAAYYRLGLRKAGAGLIDWDRYFYPLDAVADWNRLYGPRGFMQFQCALPMDSGRAGLHALLGAISRAGTGSFLAVLKRFGPQVSPVAFPMDGYTLALDFPVNRRALALMPELDRITTDHRGRFYLAKDSRMTPETLNATDPRMAEFARWRRQRGLERHFASEQSERLGL